MNDVRGPDHAETVPDPDVLDGNALGGALAMIFGGDVTGAPGCCAHCGTVSMLGEMVAYVRGPGSVLRCPVCSGVVIRVVETPTGTYVDTRGVAYLRLQRS